MNINVVFAPLFSPGRQVSLRELGGPPEWRSKGYQNHKKILAAILQNFNQEVNQYQAGK